MRLNRVFTGTAAGALLLASSLPAFGGQSAAPAAQAKPAAPAAAPAHQDHAAPPASEAFNVDVARRMTVEDLKKHLDMKHPVYILDVRGGTVGQMVKGAVHVPGNTVADWAKDIAKDAMIVTYCT